MKYALFILAALSLPILVLPKINTGKIDDHFLVKQNLITKEELINKVNQETKVIISEIEVKIKDKNQGDFFKDKPFKNVE